MVLDGVDVIDIGGESTRPGYTPVSAEEEMERVLPVIEAIRSRFDVPISLDTSKNSVAWAGIGAGADMINDIWGLTADEQMADVVAGAHIPICLMHNRVMTKPDKPEYDDFMTDVISDLKRCEKLALDAGISPENIIMDPGVGFAKNTGHNLEVMGKIDKIKALGYPVLLGASRKSVIGQVLDLPVSERLEGSLATTAWAVAHRISFVRVHDVKEHKRLIKMLEAIREYE